MGREAYFLRGEYEATIEAYSGRKGYYLDAAAWAALGDSHCGISLLRERLGNPQLSSLMSGLMGSLEALAEDRNRDAVAIVDGTRVAHEPEVQYYFYNVGAREVGHGAVGRPGTSIICDGCDDSMDVLYGLLKEILAQ